MIDDLVTKDTALLAKEKGFDEVCYHLFGSESFAEAVENGMFHRNSKINVKFDDKSGWFTAPTQTSLQKWLRKEHNIFVDIATDCTTYPKFCYEIKRFIGNPNDLSSEEWYWDKIDLSADWGLYRNYEEALEDGLKFALNLIKEK